MRRIALILAVTAFLLPPAAAQAGGFATVGLEPLPDAIPAGAPWTVRLTVLQHGRTPLVGVEPTVWIARGERRAFFPATPTGEPGVYRAVVRFPAPGRWDVEVDDGFVPGLPRHGFPAVEVTPGVPVAAPALGAAILDALAGYVAAAVRASA